MRPFAKSSRLILTSVAFGIAALAACSPAEPKEPAEQVTAPPAVETTTGPITGARDAGLNVFKGIPYAAAPIGDLRWAAPTPVEPWTDPREMTAFGPSCVQPPVPPTSVYNDPPAAMSEDCLSLNVWAPEDAEDAPVMVWIHGGSLRIGGSELPVYDGTNLAERGVVFVSINYRLGILGWLAHPELSAESPDGISSNYGLQDQIAALHWVQDNIEAFGGDAGNVTIMGESAGALSVAYLLASPEADDLFHKAVLESTGSRAFAKLDTSAYGLPSAEETGDTILKKLGYDTIEAARAADPEALIIRSTLQRFSAEGAIDGVYLTDQLTDTFDQGKQHKVPTLTGFNSGEGRTYAALLPALPETAEAYEASLRESYPDLSNDLLKVYPSDDIRESSLAMLRDEIFGWSGERYTRRQTEAGQPAYFYVFDYCYPSAREADLCSFHASEVPFVFGNMEAEGLPDVWPTPDGEQDAAISEMLIDYWTSFAATGQPVSETGPEWLPYGNAQNYLHIGEKVEAGTDPYPGMFEVNEAVMQQLRERDEAWGFSIKVPTRSKTPKE